jgi:hypothetical protein
MMTRRFQEFAERIGQLPPSTQDELAASLEAVLARAAADTSPIPELAAEVRSALERVLHEHAESITYLKDR